MEYQLTLPTARTRDPLTSHRAGARVTVRAGSQRDQLLRAYLASDHGLTDDEAGVNTGLAFKPGCCFWKRSSELRQMGLIAVTDETRISRAGEAQRVCVITDEGRRVVEGMKV